MQLYLSSHQDSSSLIKLINAALAQQDLQDSVSLQTLNNTQTATQRDLSPLSDPTVVTAVLGAGGAGTIAVAKLARVLEVLINSRKVDVKIKHQDTQIELSGPAGKIAKILADTLN